MGLFCQAATADAPWWIAVITGTGGVAVVTTMAVIFLWRKLEKQDMEMNRLARESISVIATTAEQNSQEKERQIKILSTVDLLLSHVKETTAYDRAWKNEMSEKIHALLNRS